MTETQFKEKVLDDFDDLECQKWVLKTQERGRHGVPDMLVCFQGQFIAIELKTDKGHTTSLQDLTLKRIREAGGLAIVASPRTWEGQYAVIKGMVKKVV